MVGQPGGTMTKTIHRGTMTIASSLANLGEITQCTNIIL